MSWIPIVVKVNNLHHLLEWCYRSNLKDMEDFIVVSGAPSMKSFPDEGVKTTIYFKDPQNVILVKLTWAELIVNPNG